MIAAACRTPIGAFNGSLSSFASPKLGSIVIRETLKRSGINSEEVEEVFMGCVLPAGVGQAPARQAALFADLPNTVQCTTINKVCGSGMRSVMFAAQAIKAEDAGVIIAGGMESMSNAPYLLKKAREGYRLGNGELTDSLILDGLWDVYNDYHMGRAAELCGRECNVPREAQDAFAVSSYEKALAAQKEGRFKKEIVSVEVPQRKGESVIFEDDEEPGRVKFDKIPHLKSAFEEGGTVTAANSSKINDGASAMLVLSEAKAEELNVTPMAKIVAYSSAAKAPEWFTTAPVQAINFVVKKAELKLEDIEIFEINEAFAVVGLAVSEELGLDMDKLNVNGGAVALGHPIGASGARIITTLLHAMEQRDLKLGLAAICLGGGEATAMIVER
ncbi:MAG: thiolase family protein [Candidatus Marinimicrobia bacterium]|nr:thiolase family protein [Candidatus Neomarinimicrobiota bacterium]